MEDIKENKTDILYRIEAMVTSQIKEQIELDSLRQLTSQRNIAGYAISHYYADNNLNNVEKITQKFNFLMKKTSFFQKNMLFLHKNNVFEVKIAEILAVFKLNLTKSSYDKLRECFFKDIIDLILEYKLIYPDRMEKINRIVKKHTNKHLYEFYLDEIRTVKSSPMAGVPPIIDKNTVGSIDYRNEPAGKYEDVDYENLPLSIIKQEVDNFVTIPFKIWSDNIARCENYFKEKFPDKMDYETACVIFREQLEVLKRELTQNRTK